jgi:hypothetical protein
LPWNKLYALENKHFKCDDVARARVDGIMKGVKVTDKNQVFASLLFCWERSIEQ